MLRNLLRRLTGKPQVTLAANDIAESISSAPKQTRTVAAAHRPKTVVRIETRNQRRQKQRKKRGLNANNSGRNAKTTNNSQATSGKKPAFNITQDTTPQSRIANTTKSEEITKKSLKEPSNKPSLNSRIFGFLNRHKGEALLIAMLILISTLAHSYNMFDYPYIENDEATYTSRAYAFANTGELDVYTYRYDHAPLGWMLIGFWQIITGGTYLFDTLLESGRIFMLALHVASTVVLYMIARRFSGGGLIAPTIATLMFALSPLGIYFHRRILLDNIMVFWLLLSILIVTSPQHRLKYYMGSGAAFGVAVLTKLNALFVGPAFLYIIWQRAKLEHRMHAAGYWLAAAGMVVASFFLFALLKGELFAAPIGPDGMPTHVSVVETFSLQLGRGDFAWFWDPQSSFRQATNSWIAKDWFTLGIGTISTIMIGIIGFFRRKKDPYMLFVFLLCLCSFAFLARGKIVLDLYVVPVIPLLALASGLFIQWLLNLGKSRIFKVLFTIGVITIFSLGYAGMVNNKQYFVDEVSNQTKAIDWVKKNVPKDAVIATDNYAYPELVQQNGYTNVTYFFSTEYDPEIRKTYQNDWRNIEYLIVTHEIIEQIKTGTVPRMKAVFDHAELVADYRDDASSFIDLKNYISTNGDWAQVYKVKDRNAIVQQDSWNYFKSKFVVDYGQVVDRTDDDATSSGTQATGLLRALEVGDKTMFGGIWQWSKDHLRYRQTDVLLSWQWEKQPDGSYTLGDSNTVCDADQQIAYALLQAGQRWNNAEYTKDGKAHLADWWTQCVFERNGGLYIDSSADGSQDIRLLNPGYFSPAQYRYFAKIMPQLPWQRLIDDGYALQEVIYERWLTIPNWVVMGIDGSLSSAEPLVGAGADSFGYDALQLVPRLVSDMHVASAQTDRAKALLEKLADSVRSMVSTDINPANQTANLLLRQALAAKPTADMNKDYQTDVRKPYQADKGLWYDGKNYRDQVWLWQWHQSQLDLPAEKRILLQ